MKKAAVVRARIEPILKQEAEAVLRRAGLELSNAIRLFLRQVVEHQGLPYPVSARPARVTVAPATQLALAKHEEQARQRTRSASVGRFFITPEKARAARVKWPDADHDA